MRRLKRSPAIAAAVGCLALIAAACGGSSNKGGASSTSSGNQATKQGGNVTFAIDETIPGFNVNTTADAEFVLQEVLNQVWPSAFIQGPDLKPHLNTDLLTSASVTNQNPQTVVYHINPKAVWADGTPVSAQDFIYNWQAQSGLPQYKDIDGKPFDAASTTGYANIQSVSGSPDGKTVTVTFQRNNSFGDWQSLFFNIVPAHIAQKVGWNTGFDNWQNVNSAGPFIISNYVKDQTVTETPNPKWWGAKPKLSSVTFRILSDDSGGAPAMQNGEVQIFNPSAASQTTQQQLAQVPGITKEMPAGLQFEHLDMNEANAYLSNQSVREAIAYGVNRQDLIARTVGQLNSSIKPLGNRVFMTTQPQYVNNGSAYAAGDVSKAKSLLQSAGMTMGPDGYFHPNSGPQAGQDLTFNISTTSGQALRLQEEQIIQADLKNIGIKVNVQNFSASQLFGTVLPKGQYDLAVFAWVNTIYPSGNLSIYCSFTNSSNCAQNYDHYANSQVDQLLNKAVATIDPTQAASLYNQADKLLWQTMYNLPLFQRPVQIAWTTNLANVIPNTSSQGNSWNQNEWGFKAS